MRFKFAIAFILVILNAFLLQSCSNSQFEGQANFSTSNLNLTIKIPANQNEQIRSTAVVQNYWAEVIVNGVDLNQEKVYTFDNLKTGDNTLTLVDIPIGGKRFISVFVYTKQSNEIFPLYYGEGYFDAIDKNSNINLSLTLKSAFLRENKQNIYPKIISRRLFANAEEPVDISTLSPLFFLKHFASLNEIPTYSNKEILFTYFKDNKKVPLSNFIGAYYDANINDINQNPYVYDKALVYLYTGNKTKTYTYTSIKPFNIKSFVSTGTDFYRSIPLNFYLVSYFLPFVFEKIDDTNYKTYVVSNGKYNYYFGDTIEKSLTLEEIPLTRNNTNTFEFSYNESNVVKRNLDKTLTITKNSDRYLFFDDAFGTGIFSHGSMFLFINLGNYEYPVASTLIENNTSFLSQEELYAKTLSLSLSTYNNIISRVYIPFIMFDVKSFGQNNDKVAFLRHRYFKEILTSTNDTNITFDENELITESHTIATNKRPLFLFVRYYKENPRTPFAKLENELLTPKPGLYNFNDYETITLTQVFSPYGTFEELNSFEAIKPANTQDIKKQVLILADDGSIYVYDNFSGTQITDKDIDINFDISKLNINSTTNIANIYIALKGNDTSNIDTCNLYCSYELPTYINYPNSLYKYLFDILNGVGVKTISIKNLPKDRIFASLDLNKAPSCSSYVILECFNNDKTFRFIRLLGNDGTFYPYYKNNEQILNVNEAPVSLDININKFLTITSPTINGFYTYIEGVSNGKTLYFEAVENNLYEILHKAVLQFNYNFDTTKTIPEVIGRINIYSTNNRFQDTKNLVKVSIPIEEVDTPVFYDTPSTDLLWDTTKFTSCTTNLFIRFEYSSSSGNDIFIDTTTNTGTYLPSFVFNDGSTVLLYCLDNTNKKILFKKFFVSYTGLIP